MNWTRDCVCGVVMALVSLSSVPSTGAECGVVPDDAPTLFRNSALVFTGTLVEGDQYTLTFQPDRVWKGKPAAPATVYLLENATLDSYAFRVGERYLVAARVLRADERTSNSIYDPTPEVFGMDRRCGSPLPMTLLPQLDKLARPRSMR
jgi:hypothetical protein